MIGFQQRSKRDEEIIASFVKESTRGERLIGTSVQDQKHYFYF